MSADIYRVIALTSVETDATECALSDDNAVFQLIELAQQISRVIKSDAGIAVFRPEHGDASVVGIALVEQQPINAELLEALIELRDFYESFTRMPACKANAAIAKAKGGAA